MLNQVVIVGRLVEDIKLEEQGNKKVARITLRVPRSYKNMSGDYESDYIDCILWSGIAENSYEYCKKDDLIGIKGRLQKGNNDTGMIVVAEKLTFLSAKKEESEEK